MSSHVFELSTENVPEAGVSLLDLLHENGLKPQLVMVRLDDVVIKSRDMAETRVTRESRVKVYRLVGGG